MGEIFLELLNRSITAGWLILAILVLRLALRKTPRWIFCLLWGLAAFRLICPFSLESVFSMVPSRETVRADIVRSPSPSIDSGVKAVDNIVNPVLKQTFAPETGVSVNPLQIALTLAGAVWIAGLLVMISYAAVGYIRLRLRVRTAVRLSEPVYVSEFVDTPFILGVFRPRIYLPARMPEEMQAAVLAHEHAHLKRRDHLWKALGYGLLAVYWFHPLCWAAYILFCRDIELACDERAIRGYAPEQRRSYSEALLFCSVSGGHLAAACPLAFGEIGVKERIRSVLNYKKPAFWMIFTVLVICVIVGVCFLTDPVKAGQESAGGSGTEREGNIGGSDEGGGGSGAENIGSSGQEGSNPSVGNIAGTDREDESDPAAGNAGQEEPSFRLRQADWDAVRRQELSVGEELREEGIRCIARIPEEEITLYGADNGEGVTVELGRERFFYNWLYNSPRDILPDCFWDKAGSRLQVALNVYTGTGADAQELHVLQYRGGELRDNTLELNDYSGMLCERISFTYDQETHRITLTDSKNGSELAVCDTGEIEGTVRELELGNISRFLLGEKLYFQVGTGYFPEEQYGVAEYDGMPVLRMEILMKEAGDGSLLFELGEIRVEE